MKNLPLIVLVTMFAIAASNAENQSSNTKKAEPRDARQDKEPNKDKDKPKQEAQKDKDKDKQQAQKEKDNHKQQAQKEKEHQKDKEKQEAQKEREKQNQREKQKQQAHKEHQKEKEKQQAQKEKEKQEAIKAQQKEAAARQVALRKEIDDGTDRFEHSNSRLDLLRGKISYAKPTKDGQGYVAYLHLNWGDLDKQISNNGPIHYSNWDGSVKLQQGGKASVVKEFAFDDRDGTTGGVDGHDGLGRNSGRNIAKPGESGFGSGRDTLIRDSESSMVAWKSGVVGATDGLLIRLELRQAATRGVIQAGNFTVPFETKLKH